MDKDRFKIYHPKNQNEISFVLFIKYSALAISTKCGIRFIKPLMFNQRLDTIVRGKPKPLNFKLNYSTVVTRVSNPPAKTHAIYLRVVKQTILLKIEGRNRSSKKHNIRKHLLQRILASWKVE